MALKGVDHPKSKVSDEEIALIRADYESRKYKLKELAEKYNHPLGTIKGWCYGNSRNVRH